MAKRTGKFNISTLIFASVILLIVGILSVAATFAFTDNWLHIGLPYDAASSTDTVVAAADGTNVVTVTYTRGNGEYHFTSYDLVYYIEGENTGLVLNVSLESTAPAEKPSVMKVELAGSVVAAYAYPANESNGAKNVSYGNVFVEDFFGLQAINNEKNANPSDPVAANGALKNVFIVGDLTVDKPLTFTPPCAVHLLRSTVTLSKNLTLKHNYGGIYGIDSAGGKFVQNGGVLAVVTPNAYFGIAAGAVTDERGGAVTPSVTCSPDVLTAENAAALVSGMLTSSAEYLTNFVPSRLTHNVVLPSAYAASGVTYTYAVTAGGDRMTADGVIFRGEVSANATLAVTAAYNGIYASVLASTAEQSFDLALTVVGTGAQAAADELGAMLGEVLARSLTEKGGKFSLTGDVELTELLKRYAALRFSAADDVMLAVSEPSGTALSVNGILANDYNVTARGDADTVRLTVPARVINGAPLTVTASCGSASSALTYTLAGMTVTEVTDYLETLIYSPEFASVESTYGYIGYYDGVLYRGDERAAISLGVRSAEVKAIGLTDEELTALESAADPQSYISAKWAGWSTKDNEFAIAGLAADVSGNLTGGTVKAKALASGVNYVIVQKFVIDTDLGDTGADGDPTEIEYFSFRTALVPEMGIGGSDTTQYIAGNTFADFYETLDNGRLLESGGYAFSVSTAGISIYTVIEGENIGDYCYFAYKDVSGNYVRVTAADALGYEAGEYFIYVDVTKFPERNASAKAKIYFYYSQQRDAFMRYAQGGFIDDPDDPGYNAADAASCFTTQSYGFTLPGIYRVGAAFVSEPLYDLVLNAKNSDGSYIYDAYRKNADAAGEYTFALHNYLYVDGASAACASLDATAIGGGTAISLKGIELLTGTSGFVFDGVTISDVAGAFSAVNTHIMSLSMAGCGLTSEILGSSLTNCQGLTSVDLSSNAIASVGGLLYRTVSSLRLSGCGLTTIVGISELPNLTELCISHNAIKYFGELTSLAKLKTVDVSFNTVASGNIALGGGVAYGTEGEVNIPVYVYLLNVREATVTGNNGNIAVGAGLTSAQQIASLILTGVEYDRTVTDTVFSKEVKWGSAIYTVASLSTVGADLAEKIPTVDGENFYFIVSVTYNGTTCYALYEAAFAGGAA